MKRRVMLVDDSHALGEHMLEAGLTAADCEIMCHIRACFRLCQDVKDVQPDIVVVRMPTVTDELLAQLQRLDAEHPLPVVVFTADSAPERVRAAITAGVCGYVVAAPDVRGIKPVIDVAVAQFDRLRMVKEELRRVSGQLSERKLIERAKGILMRQLDCTEDQAYDRMRAMAMNRNLRLVEVSNSIIMAARMLE
ncbi:MAG: ANTAR domain-containing protein [Gammaproteobacteria bacterium]|nr:ANTAR domain-containing protein [Gammaproteobacteria bacterium]